MKVNSLNSKGTLVVTKVNLFHRQGYWIARISNIGGYR